jgi:hypothetical protein
MTEAEELSGSQLQEFYWNNKLMAKTLTLPSLICVFCEICGFKFGGQATFRIAGPRNLRGRARYIFER